MLPEYYRELIETKKQKDKELKAQKSKANEAISDEGDLLLCFRDKRTAAYWNGTWNPGTKALDLFPAPRRAAVRTLPAFSRRGRRRLHSYLERVFDPKSDKVVDMDNHTVNLWTPSQYLRDARCQKEAHSDRCPTINKIIESAVGKGPVKEHSLNWLAVMIQHRVSFRTAWICHGTQGTGKGLLINKILRPIIGDQYVVTRLQNELKGEFSAFLEFALIVFIDEIEVDSLESGGSLESKLKFYITEPTVPIRRMRTDSYSVPSFTGLIGSNKAQPVVIPRNDRRYNVGEFQKVPLVISIDEVETKLPSSFNTSPTT